MIDAAHSVHGLSHYIIRSGHSLSLHQDTLLGAWELVSLGGGADYMKNGGAQKPLSRITTKWKRTLMSAERHGGWLAGVDARNYGSLTRSIQSLSAWLRV